MTIVWVVLACWVSLAVVLAPVVGLALRRRTPGTLAGDGPVAVPSVAPAAPGAVVPATARPSVVPHGEVGVA